MTTSGVIDDREPMSSQRTKPPEETPAQHGSVCARVQAACPATAEPKIVLSA